MTDADVDGSHIRTLLLTFFFRHMLGLIQEGHLYIAQPPIFRLVEGKNSQYFYGEAGMQENEILTRALTNFKDPEKVKVSRYKGLGEMNPEQLWETTMDPQQRTLLQVTIEDAAEADRVFDMLMGSSVPPRRRFIQTHAKSVRNLDI
jgi:DNA gyrase subunit B